MKYGLSTSGQSAEMPSCFLLTIISFFFHSQPMLSYTPSSSIFRDIMSVTFVTGTSAPGAWFLPEDQGKLKFLWLFLKCLSANFRDQCSSHFSLFLFIFISGYPSPFVTKYLEMPILDSKLIPRDVSPTA